MGAVAVAHKGGIVVEHHLMTTVIVIIVIEVIEQLGNLPLVLHEEGLQHPELTIASHLADHHPVDICVGIEGDDERQLRVEVAVLPTVIGNRTIVEVLEVQHILIRCRVKVHILTHTTVEAIRTNLDADAHDRCGEGERRQVALGTADKLLAKQREVLDAGILLIEKALRPQEVELCVDAVYLPL